MTQFSKTYIDKLMYHYTDDYLETDNLLALRHSIVKVDDCKHCNQYREITGSNYQMDIHLQEHMECFQTLHKQLDLMFHRDYSLSPTTLDDMLNRKQSIIHVLLTNTIDFKRRVFLENIIVSIDNRIAKSHKARNVQFKQSVLDVMHELKLEMFKLDDLIEYKMKQ